MIFTLSWRENLATFLPPLKNFQNSNSLDSIFDQAGLRLVAELSLKFSLIEKNIFSIQVEKDELQAALEEAESALEQEENRVLRAQMDVVQARQVRMNKKRINRFNNKRLTGLNFLPHFVIKLLF